MFVCSTNSLLIDLFYGKKKWMAKTEIIQSAQVIKDVPINKLLSIIENFPKLLKKSVIWPKGRAHRGLPIICNSLGDYQKAIQYHKKDLKIAREIGDR